MGGEMAVIFGTYGGLRSLYGLVCVFSTFDTHSHKFQHIDKLHKKFHDDRTIRSIFGEFFITVYQRCRTVRRLGLKGLGNFDVRYSVWG